MIHCRGVTPNGNKCKINNCINNDGFCKDHNIDYYEYYKEYYNEYNRGLEIVKEWRLGEDKRKQEAEKRK